MKIINKNFGESVLPNDPRILLQTSQNTDILKISGGEYWHQGIGKCLNAIFWNIAEPNIISLNINIDGLPIYNSSKVELWPILFNIAEMPEISAKVVGIFCGASKTSDIESFLTPFVDEMREIMNNGLHINSHKITVRLHCFTCDIRQHVHILKVRAV